MIRLHHVPFSRSFRVLWLMTEMDLDFEITEYKIADGSLRTAEMMAISPAGRVPGLEIDGKELFESGAILEYLTETRPEHGFGCSPSEPERARYLQFMYFAETIASQIEALNLSQIFLRDPKEASPTVIKVTTARLKGTLAALEAQLKDGSYLLEKGFSAADAMMGFNLFAAPYYVKLDPFPLVSGYKDMLASRPAFKAARARDGEQDFYTKDFYPVPGSG